MMFQHLFHVLAHNNLGKKSTPKNISDLIQPSQSFGQAQQHVYVNASNGNLYLEDHAKTIVDFGFRLNIGMIYNCQADGQFTPNWRLSVGKLLGTTNANNIKGSTVVLQNTDGSNLPFNYDTDKKCYIAKGLPNGDEYLTQKSDGSWQWWHPGTGTTQTFDKPDSKTLQSKQMDQSDPAGHKLSYQYDD